MKFKIIILSSMVVLFLSLIQCGYQLTGKGGFLPPHIETVSVPMFKNNTGRYQLDQKLTQAIVNELITRGKFKVLMGSQKADSLLLGEILSFTVTPISFSEDTRADRYSITIVAKVTFKDLVTKKTIFTNPNYIFRDEYELTGGSDFFSEETEAIERISENFARSVVSTILEGF